MGALSGLLLTAAAAPAFAEGDNAPGKINGKGAVFVQGDNPALGNQLYTFLREDNGNLAHFKTYPTGGKATGAGNYTNGNGSGETWVNEGTHSVVRDGDLLFVTNSGPGLDLTSLLGSAASTVNSLTGGDLNVLRQLLGGVTGGTSGPGLSVLPALPHITALGIGDVLSGSVTVFKIQSSGLVLQDVAFTNGTNPVSVARYGKIVVVLNEKNNTVQSYKLSTDNKLTPVSNVLLNNDPIHSGVLAHASDIVFNKEGTKLVVAERQYPSALALPDQKWFIDVASVDPNTGVISNVVVNDVATPDNAGTLTAEPFGILIAKSGVLAVTHGRYEVPYGSYEATYKILPDNKLQRTSFVPSGGWDDCWSVTVASKQAGREWYYVQSFFDSALWVAPLTDVLGEFRFLDNTSALLPDVPAGLGGTDIAATPSETNSVSRTFVYALNNPSVPGTTQIVGFEVDRATGETTRVGAWGNNILPITAVGIAAR